MSREMKDSGVEWIGEIPEDNNIIRTKYLLTYIKGKNPNILNSDKIGIPYIGASDLDKEKSFYEYENYTTEKLPNCDYEDILVLWDGARAGLIGRHHKGVISSTIVNIIPNTKFISKNFYYWYLKGFERYLYDLVGGTTIPHMNRTFIENIYMIDFSIPQQQKIADFLDEKVSEIDNIIAKTKLSIEEYKKYKQSIITEAVTKGLNPNVEIKDSGVEWIDKTPKHWDFKKIKYIFSIKKDISGIEGYDILSVTQSGIKIKDISANEGQISADYSKYQLVNVGDFVMNHMDLLTGWVDCSKYHGVTSPDYRVFKFINQERFSSEYYKYIMQVCYTNKIFYGLGQGVSNLGRWRLQTEKFINFILPIPPKEEQQQISDYINKKCLEIDNLISQKQKLLADLDLYKKSLIYEYVTGKREV